MTLTATVTPATAVGAVHFKDGTTNLGSPVMVSNGTASGSTSTLAMDHQLTAVFTQQRAGVQLVDVATSVLDGNEVSSRIAANTYL